MSSHSYKMSGKAMSLYRIRIVLIAVALSFICGGIMVFSVRVAVVLIVFLAVLLSVLIIWLPHFIYKGHYMAIEHNQLSVTKRLIFSRIHYVRVNEIRYVTISATPLQRYFNIFSVYIYTTCGRVCIANIDSLPPRLKGFVR